MVAKSNYEIGGREQLSYDSMTHVFKRHCVIIEQKKIDVKLSSMKKYKDRIKKYDKSLKIESNDLLTYYKDRETSFNRIDKKK